ncbi:hypothetical protein C8Q80DRAFT_1221541 [Daedaleopsis nitida]|nr:hypothetical protein C8Q80DRAFT_1221541 [Daedaleopsis nitida]
MAPGNKRQASATSGGSKKKQCVSFKMHNIPPPASSGASQNTGGPRTTIIDTRSYQEWLPLRQEFLDELLRFHGGEHAVDTGDACCATCEEPSSSLLHCVDCASRTVHCPNCILIAHKHLPLHKLEQWNTKMWVKRELRDLGLVVQLGHDGLKCPHPAENTQRLVIGDVSGIHQVQVRFCKCLNAEDEFTHQWVQVFRTGWFPAMTNRPAMAFTFRMLSAFHELNLWAKMNLYDYWHSLERLTDNTGSGARLNRYTQATHVMRLWRHLTSLKRGARAHDPSGARGTQDGQLALECPACSQPGKNLPDGWESAPPETRWIYTLFLMLDANFRAKLKDRGLEDIELSPGWSYYVENAKFKSHVQSIGIQSEKNGCSAEHRAIQNANLRRQAYIASGVGAVLCMQHAMVRKNAVGDLPNGEKFLIMDYLLFSTILGITLLLLISYDIACQWHKKLARRALKDLPPHIATNIAALDIRYAIPKKHIQVHGPNHSRFSFNYLRWVGQTYGEGIEAHWAHMNPVAPSAREMAPGMRREHMDDHWSGWNWQKIVGFGAYLLKLLRKADWMHAKQQAAHDSLSVTFKPEDVARWDAEVRAWQENPTDTDDPYEEHRPSATIKSTRLQIADKEAKELADGTLPPHDVLPGVFLQVALELEEQQQSLKHRQKKASATDTSLADVQEKRTVLQRRIEAWQELQNLHMPVVTQFRHSDNPDSLAGIIRPSSSPSSEEPRRAEDTRLWMPSALPEQLRSSLSPGLVDKEHQLRIAQADDALDDIRRLHRILVGIADFRRLNVRTLFAKFEDKVQRAAHRYRAVRSALENLNKGGEWEARLKVPADEDLCGPGRNEDEHPSEGWFEISWIWLVPRGSGSFLPEGVQGDLNPEEFLANVKVKWAHNEEVILLKEEMQRVIEYFRWKSRWWSRQGQRRPDVAVPTQRGLSSVLNSDRSDSSSRKCLAVGYPTWSIHLDSAP